jgi:glycosyltransferase involved in cell wall biosynthesis
MDYMKYYFNDISLLITHYNRSKSLERLLNTIENNSCSFNEIIISDDGSQGEHFKRLKSLQEKFSFNLITTPANKGLGNNINKGQDAVTSPYTLYIQEDFIPQNNFAERLKDGLEFMKTDKSIDIVRFYAYFEYPYLKPYGKGFSEMKFKFSIIKQPDYHKFLAYSDHPHLRRSLFFEKFGRYAEGYLGYITENKMEISFLRNKGKGLFYKDYTNLLTQLNDSEEPSTENFPKTGFFHTHPVMKSVVKPIYRYIKASIRYYFWHLD